MFKNNEVILLQQRFKNEAHNVFRKKVINIVICFNDDKSLQSVNGVKSYPHGTSARKLCK